MAATATGDLLARARSGDKRSIARLVSVVENDEPGAAEAMRELYPKTGHAQTVGITGPPGGAFAAGQRDGIGAGAEGSEHFRTRAHTRSL